MKIETFKKLPRWLRRILPLPKSFYDNEKYPRCYLCNNCINKTPYTAMTWKTYPPFCSKYKKKSIPVKVEYSLTLADYETPMWCPLLTDKEKKLIKKYSNKK